MERVQVASRGGDVPDRVPMRQPYGHDRCTYGRRWRLAAVRHRSLREHRRREPLNVGRGALCASPRSQMFERTSTDHSRSRVGAALRWCGGGAAAPGRRGSGASHAAAREVGHGSGTGDTRRRRARAVDSIASTPRAVRRRSWANGHAGARQCAGPALGLAPEIAPGPARVRIDDASGLASVDRGWLPILAPSTQAGDGPARGLRTGWRVGPLVLPCPASRGCGGTGRRARFRFLWE